MTGAATTRLLLGLVLLLLLAPSPAGAQSRQARFELAKKDLERANRLRADLEGTPEEQRKEKDYQGVVFLYRRVYDRAPFSSLAADALAAAAETYHEMGKQFGAQYWHEAIDTYKFLRREYPHSNYGDNALFNIAQLYHVHLKDLPTALAAYEDVVNTYSRSRFAATARDRIKSIKAEQEAAERAKRAPPAPTPAAKADKEVVEVRNIRYWNAKNYSRVVVDLEGEVEFQGGHISNPERIFFDLFNTRLSTVLTGKTFEINEGLLDRIRVAENRAGVTRVVLEVKTGENHTVFSLPNPFRLVVDIRGPTVEAASRPRREPAEATRETAKMDPASVPRPPTTPKPTADGNHTLSRALGLKASRIVIDPGHGGHDTGSIGPTGLMEKDLVLDIARRLGKLLSEQVGAEVVFTREDDTFVPLENRIAVANAKQADLFLSIHANSSRRREVRGVETFYLNFTSDPEVLELAARENALSQKSIHELQDLVRSISRSEKINESRELARALQKHLHDELRRTSGRIQNRGVKQAPFVVLIGGNMPSALTEIAFLSNPEDEQLMKSPQGRQTVADALFAGMTKYLEDINSVAFASEKASDSQ